MTDIEPTEKGDRHQRRRDIALLVAQKGRITVEEIRETFGVSGVTARGDLDALASLGDLVRSHGGAVSNSLTVTPVSDEQVKLAQAACSLLKPLETVMIAAGESTLQMARLMRQSNRPNITVITYSLHVASLVSDLENVSLVMLGGLHHFPSSNFLGPQSEQMMRSLHAEHCFLNPPGFRLDSGLTCADIMEAQLIQCMMQAASQVTVLAESKSLGNRSLAWVGNFDQVDRVICQSDATTAEVTQLKNQSVEVTFV